VVHDLFENPPQRPAVEFIDDDIGAAQQLECHLMRRDFLGKHVGFAQ